MGSIPKLLAKTCEKFIVYLFAREMFFNSPLNFGKVDISNFLSHESKEGYVHIRTHILFFPFTAATGAVNV